MKKIFGLIAVLVLCGSIRAGVIFGTLSPITTATTNSPTFITNTAYINVPVIYVANSILMITNGYYGFFRWSFDNTTFYTNTSPTFIPTVTNAASYTVPAQVIQVPVYIQMLAVTNVLNTNTISIGASTP